MKEIIISAVITFLVITAIGFVGSEDYKVAQFNNELQNQCEKGDYTMEEYYQCKQYIENEWGDE